MPRSKAASQTRTIYTVDDVFHDLESRLGEASLKDSKEHVMRLCKNDITLASETIGMLESPIAYLAPICKDPAALLRLMLSCNTVLGGPQATSIFYPICKLANHPWDFFCGTQDGDPDSFNNRIRDVFGDKLSLVEAVDADSAEKVVHYRTYIIGTSTPVNIRVFISPGRTIDAILDLQYSYSQSFISAAGAICFWPHLTANNQYRTFENNQGLSKYPVGRTRTTSTLISLTGVRPKSRSTEPVIYSGLNRRLEHIMFSNNYNVRDNVFNNAKADLTGLVYAVGPSTTRYLGSTSNMK